MDARRRGQLEPHAPYGRAVAGRVIILDAFLQFGQAYVFVDALILIGVAPVVYPAALYAAKR